MRSRREDMMRRGHQSDWYSDSFGRRRNDQPRGHQRTRNPRRRTRSPGDRNRMRRIQGRSRERSQSLEPRDFGRHAGENSDHVRGGQSPFDYRRILQPGSEETEGRLQFDERFSRRDSPAREFRRSYLVPERHGVNLEANNGIKFGGVRSDTAFKSKEKDFQSGNSVSVSVDHRMLVQKSMFMDDGNSHSLYELHSERYPIEDINLRRPTGDPMRSDIGYHDFGGAHVHLNKIPLREPYEVEGRKKPKLYSRDRPYLPLAPTSTALGSYSSGLSRDTYFPSFYQSSPRLSPGVFSRGEKSSDAVISDRPGPSNIFDRIHDPDMRLKNLKLYQTAVSPVRDEPRYYVYSEFGRREREPSGFADDDLYKKMPMNARVDYSPRETLRTASFMETVGDTVNNDTSQSSFIDRASWDDPLHGKPSEFFHDTHLHPLTDKRHGEFFSSRKLQGDFAMPKGPNRPFMNLADDHEYGRGEDPLSYREVPPRSIHEQEMEAYMLDRSPQHMLHTGELDNIPPDGRLKGKFDRGPKSAKIRISTHKNKRISTRILRTRDINEHLVDEGNAGRSFAGISKCKGTESWFSVQHGTEQVKGGFLESCLPSGRSVILRKRSRIGDSEFSHPFRKHENRGHWSASRSHKVNMEDKSAVVDKETDKQQDEPPNIKSDPPEDSGEFKQLVHKAFLRFSKQLNENPGQQRRYREQGKAGNLLCLACGSLSREFSDAHSLVAHAYSSLKVGLRTDHLGLHKALCILLGWNCLVAPDNAKAYQSMPAAEASVLKEDLLLWPPVVIIHDSIRNRNAETTDAMTSNNIEDTLRGMGFSGGKVYKGRPANQGVFVVKFLPTFSGLREAERLHNHFAENKHGKRELQLLRSKNGPSDGENEAASSRLAEFLYGYLGIAEDLDKLDYESKKRCVVKSRKDIEAIADARLDSD